MIELILAWAIGLFFLWAVLVAIVAQVLGKPSGWPHWWTKE